MKRYLKILFSSWLYYVSLPIVITVGSVGIYNLGWVIDYSEHPIIFIILGWLASIYPTPALLYLVYLQYKREK